MTIPTLSLPTLYCDISNNGSLRQLGQTVLCSYRQIIDTSNFMGHNDNKKDFSAFFIICLLTFNAISVL